MFIFYHYYFIIIIKKIIIIIIIFIIIIVVVVVYVVIVLYVGALNHYTNYSLKNTAIIIVIRLELVKSSSYLNIFIHHKHVASYPFLQHSRTWTVIAYFSDFY